jgi:hypothetical protein
VIDTTGRRWLKRKPERRISTARNECVEVSEPNGPIPSS